MEKNMEVKPSTHIGLNFDGSFNPITKNAGIGGIACSADSWISPLRLNSKL